jgi:membrane associated rhomboid family serine protease
MSFLQRLTRTFRPTTALRARQGGKTTTSNFFSPQPVHRIGLGQRFSSFYSYERNATQNRNILYGIIGLNTGVFAYSAYLHVQAKQGFPGPWIRFYRNMTLNVHDVLKEGKWWTMITSVFNHAGILHLGFNMLTTYYLGGMVAAIPGITPLRFITIILGSGISGSIGFLWLNTLKTKEPQNQRGSRQAQYTRGLGFSGAATGLGVVAAFVYPKATMMIYGIVPAPLWLVMLGFVAYDGYYMNDNNSKTAHAGHLGGAAFGFLYFLARMRGLR